MEKNSIELEYIFRASPTILYKFLTAPDCLIRWFSEGVHIIDDKFHFQWQGYEEVAILLDKTEGEFLRFMWEDAKSEDEFFEFRMYTADVTGETVLEIEDVVDEEEMEEQEDFWNTQMEKLKKACGG